MKDKQTASYTDEKIADKPKKNFYASPVLYAYGSVSKLTKGGSGSQVDGSNFTKAFIPPGHTK